MSEGSKDAAGEGAQPKTQAERDSHVEPRSHTTPPSSSGRRVRRDEVDTKSSPAPIEIGPLSSEADSIVSRDTVPAPLPTAEAVGPLSRTLAAGESLVDDDSEDDAVADPLIGLVVADRYRIVDRIGRGGMGIVYRVEHTSIGKLLAMKLLAGELSVKKDVVRRFKLEALTVSRLSSPHTVQVFDYGVWNHLTYLVMELVDGMDLSRMIRRYGPLPFSRLGRLMIQVCASLEEAHEKGITHRDIKPENIMIIADARGVEMAKVLDFGLAKLRESSELNEVTLQGAVIGTPYFISPEQVHGDDVDGRSDIYSLGAVMFRGLTGTYPFHAKNPIGMFTKHLSEPAPSAQKTFPDLDIPSGVSAAIEKCMAKDPGERFQSIAELREALLTELGALPLSSQERISLEDVPSDPSPSAEALRRRKKAERAAAAEVVKSQIATRAELEAYERKLRRARYGAWVLLLVVLLTGLGGVATYLIDAGARGIAGQESEPNDAGAQANRLFLGTPVTGLLGKRIDRGTGDRDFYAFELPSDGAVSIEVTALPNIPVCAIIYRAGFTQPLAELCTGYAGLDLNVPSLRLAAGPYFIALTQDLLHQGPGESRYVVENVSDAYRLTVDAVEPAKDEEVEPNDSRDSAQTILLGGEVRGHIGWVGDEDVFCLEGDVAVIWEVDDAPRPPGTALQVTPTVGPSPSPLVRLHPAGARPGDRPRLEADVNVPWASPAYAPGERRCVTLELTSDPWTEGHPHPSGARYILRARRP